MKKISALILAYNEVEKIEAAIASVLWADEVVVVDSGSTDGTVEIAEKFGAHVVQIPFCGFGELRNQALAACRLEWVFSLDSDERCTPEVRDEILALLDGEPEHDAYVIPRHNFLMGRWIRGSGWYPNYRQPQLFRAGAMSYTLEPVHEGYVIHSGRAPGRLTNAIWQIPFHNFQEIIYKMDRYSTLGATKLQGRHSMGRALGHGVWAFVKHFFIKLGFLDGWAGFVIAFGNMEGTFWRYAKAYEMSREWKRPEMLPLTRPPVL